MEFREIGGPSDKGEYVEPAKGKKRGRKGEDTPQVRERKAKTEAVFKMRHPDAVQKEPPTTKKVLKRRTDTSDISQEPQQGKKLLKGESKEPIEVQPEGELSLEKLPLDIRIRILEMLPRKDQHTMRQVDSAFNDAVIWVESNRDPVLLDKFTNFLRSKLTGFRLAPLLQTPEEITKAFEITNLDDRIQALYDARSRVINILAMLEEDKVQELEQAYQETGNRLPSKFENIFGLALLNSRVLPLRTWIEIGDSYELARQIKRQAPYEQFSLGLQIINALISDPLTLKLNTVDKPSFRIFEEIFSNPDYPHKSSQNWGLLRLHTVAIVKYILTGNSEKCFESIDKTVRYIALRLKGPAVDDPEGIHLRISPKQATTQTLMDILRATELGKIDNKLREQIISYFEEGVYLAVAEKPELVIDINSAIIEVFADLDLYMDLKNELFETLTNYINYIDNLPDIDTKLAAINIMKRLKDDGLTFTPLVDAIGTCKESDIKNALLVSCYSTAANCLNKPDWAKGNIAEQALSFVQKIVDPILKEKIMNMPIFKSEL